MHISRVAVEELDPSRRIPQGRGAALLLSPERSIKLDDGVVDENAFNRRQLGVINSGLFCSIRYKSTRQTLLCSSRCHHQPDSVADDFTNAETKRAR
ncbi:hypothetical protein EVAR_31228_1 [Eumeta japonica]|uniref:Uncharacterized protein n=1 Tax=Eumeta variegata TaxID=151549 RepID=A0A4C1W2P3_EUMVA|nr:hypothetical protein EVAR_31228_1 [Eumeta japonica]